ncbi:hypothetical protein H6F86_01970 [Phormidium sp. FACHB-592]|uniref:Uncharacterized protein n=1 Tax=Stenomitos frigidus AS-A4 TaxID=2933935 RepID=A0ABV0KJN4_9CYAN|nr:hypothetical protein [Phormidium sp. FACHB-592]MBD2072673.1 hypothetical protein [Phormidium sp. FACHB-592]
MHFDVENFEFDEEWLREVSRVEQESNCDVQAGFDWGANLGDYITSAKSFINQAKLMSVLQEELESLVFQGLLSQEDIEIIANAAQSCTRDRVIGNIQSAKSA